MAIVIVQNSLGEFFIHQRSENKKTFPLLYGVGIGGKVEKNESFLEGAQRELQEELGARGILKYLFNFSYQSPELEYEAHLYYFKYDGTITPSTIEFKTWKWETPDSIEKMGKLGKLCPDTKVFFKRHIQSQA